MTNKQKICQQIRNYKNYSFPLRRVGLSRLERTERKAAVCELGLELDGWGVMSAEYDARLLILRRQETLFSHFHCNET